MSFFDRFNAPVARASYKKMTELALFLPMRMVDIKKSTTQVGTTTQINCILNGAEIFFYLNPTDHAKFLEEDYQFLKGEVVDGRAPIVFIAKTRNGLMTCILMYTVELMTAASDGRLLKVSKIPEGVRDALDLADLLRQGIILQD